MSQRTLLVAIDLGTSTTTASHVLVRNSLDGQGKLHREVCGRVIDVSDWPGASHGDATGLICVPTDLVYDKSSRQLLLWGFHAQYYLDDPSSEIPFDQVFVVEHIKLFLPDPDDVIAPTAASLRYRALRENLAANLGKDPYEVFEDFMNQVVEHIIGSANRRYGMHSQQVEVVIAFPSGWPEYIHTKVARIGARAMEKAIATHGLQNMVFGIENVYTVSETLCGVKEWLQDTLAEAANSSDIDQPQSNLDQLNEGDCFLPIDIGGGTGCMTPLRLVTKSPLRVDQLGPTQSLEVSGEAIEAEFERWLRPRITKKDYPDDIPLLVHKTCRAFREEKKKCGNPPVAGFLKWKVPATSLKANTRKGFEQNCMMIDRKFLDACFDPILDTLESAIKQTLRDIKIKIKAIVFLGQFGGSSEYLRKRMAKSLVSRRLRIQYSQSGKLNVVRGAMSERLCPSQSFVRNSITLKSYGTLITLPYSPGSEAEKHFPDPGREGAVPFEDDSHGLWLKAIEWAIPKGTLLEDGGTYDVGKDGRRHHTWRSRETYIAFEDIIVVSDEIPPDPQFDGKSYTLWTRAHEQNQLIINNNKMQVHQIPFSWDLTMSQKIDLAGNVIGQYEIGDLETYMFPEVKRKGKRRDNFRRLDYDLVWDITEMQVKVHVRAIFPNPIGPLTIQLAQERQIGAHEKALVGESRSTALKVDIELTNPARLGSRAHAKDNLGVGIESEVLSDISGSQIDAPQLALLSLACLEGGSRSMNNSSPEFSRNTLQTTESSSSQSFRLDGRHREGCYTCKDRRKKCDCEYTFDEIYESYSCQECMHFGINCCMTRPEWARDPKQVSGQQLKRKEKVKLGRKKSRENFSSSSTVSRDR